ncbi:MAG TPA: DMT family transporter [Anaeromyxobacteraceae bacterium]|nr:DMT family transporter [Anaeromyxobacteraceae bacterium]
MRRHRVAVLSVATLACFASNSLLARAALREGLADPATFSAVRLASGAGLLALVAFGARRGSGRAGSWGSAFALFAYAGAFSLSYVRIGAATGALLLFPAVQATMIAWSVAHGAAPTRRQWGGIALALGGLAVLTLPGAQAPDLVGALFMVGAGVAWGVYSIRGRVASDPVATTAGNFLRTVPMALALVIAYAAAAPLRATLPGVGLAVLSGAIASAGGYIAWYAILPALGQTRAATLQIAVPVVAAAGAVVLLGEPVSARLVASGVAIVAGIAAVVSGSRPPSSGAARGQRSARSAAPAASAASASPSTRHVSHSRSTLAPSDS